MIDEILQNPFLKSLCPYDAVRLSLLCAAMGSDDASMIGNFHFDHSQVVRRLTTRLKQAKPCTSLEVHERKQSWNVLL